MPQPQSQHSHPVRVHLPPTSDPGLLLGWGVGRLWGPQEPTRSQGGYKLTVLPAPLTPGPEALPPPPLPRLALGVLPQLLLMTCNWRSALSARSRSSSMNCCSRSLALASRAAVSFRNWSICTTSLGQEQSLTPGPWPDCPQISHWRRAWPVRRYLTQRPVHGPMGNAQHMGPQNGTHTYITQTGRHDSHTQNPHNGTPLLILSP